MLGNIKVMAAIWISACSVYAFSLFGLDKYRAKNGHHRISEAHLLVAAALGGLPGAFLGMFVFRHKTAKTTFLLKFVVAFLVWLGLLVLAVMIGPS